MSYAEKPSISGWRARLSKAAPSAIWQMSRVAAPRTATRPIRVSNFILEMTTLNFDVGKRRPLTFRGTELAVSRSPEWVGSFFRAKHGQYNDHHYQKWAKTQDVAERFSLLGATICGTYRKRDLCCGKQISHGKCRWPRGGSFNNINSELQDDRSRIRYEAKWKKKILSYESRALTVSFTFL